MWALDFPSSPLYFSWSIWTTDQKNEKKKLRSSEFGALKGAYWGYHQTAFPVFVFIILRKGRSAEQKKQLRFAICRTTERSNSRRKTKEGICHLSSTSVYSISSLFPPLLFCSEFFRIFRSVSCS